MPQPDGASVCAKCGSQIGGTIPHQARAVAPAMTSAPSKSIASPTKKSGLVIALYVGMACLALLIVIPGFLRSREVSRARKCQENLSKIEGAKEQYALEHNVDPSITPLWTDLLRATQYLKRKPVCPNGGTYKINDLNSVPECNCRFFNRSEKEIEQMKELERNRGC